MLIRMLNEGEAYPHNIARKFIFFALKIYFFASPPKHCAPPSDVLAFSCGDEFATTYSKEAVYG